MISTRTFRRLALSVLATLAVSESVRAQAETIDWQKWSPAVFAQAKREHKFVLLDLQAVWCHWCHVMDQQTYADPKVAALIRAHYIAVKVDQDARPDLSNRYEDYGWPATVVFNGEAGEIVKRQGFLPPAQMASMLQAIVDDPSPGPSVTNAPSLDHSGNIFSDDAGIRALQRQFVAGYDAKLGGWSLGHKFLDWDNVEYALHLARQGDVRAAGMAKQTLDAQRKLIDPVWGGVDQYSIDDWDHPHFEKLMQMQAEDIRIFALAHEQWKDPAYLQAATRIYGYVRNFLTAPGGGFYTSQDADIHDGQAPESYYQLDDAGRRKIGVPRIDRHIYARENGWFIQALCSLFEATGEAHFRDEAATAARWVVDHRSAAGGGFTRDGDATRFYLGDTLAMGQAFLDLYTVTGDNAWLARAENAADFIRARFAAEPSGFVTATRAEGDVLTSTPEFDENVALARFANLLAHDANDARDRATAQAALDFVSAPGVDKMRGGYVGGLLLAEDEDRSDPLHLVLVGRKGAAPARDLYAGMLAAATSYKQLLWLDPGDPAQASELAPYPPSSKPAAYICTQTTCSPPVFAPAGLDRVLDRALVPEPHS